jgi:acetyl esterase/lipase
MSEAKNEEKLPTFALPGRLGNPDAAINNDPRVDPRLVALLTPLQLAGRAPTSKLLYPSTDWDTICSAHESMGPMFDGLFTMLAKDLPAIGGIEEKTETVKGVDGNDIKLFITSPKGLDADLPCVVHCHGGGMALLSAEGKLYTQWRQELASRGLVVVGVEFRNSTIKPFPAGLNDCISAVDWIHENKKSLHVSTIVTHGESGGGNLCIATALSLHKKDETKISGVFSYCPYISRLYHRPDEAKELQSLWENNGYFLEMEGTAVTASIYDRLDEKTMRNPLAWPYWATTDDLKGMPPVCVVVDECDPLRDEGLAFARNCRAAGVGGTTSMLAGTIHGAAIVGQGAISEVSRSMLDSIASFCKSL